LIDFIDDEEPDSGPTQDDARPEFKDILDEGSDDSFSAYTTDDSIVDDEFEAMDIDDSTEAEDTEAEIMEVEAIEAELTVAENPNQD